MDVGVRATQEAKAEDLGEGDSLWILDNSQKEIYSNDNISGSCIS